MSTLETSSALRDCAEKSIDTTPGNKNFAPSESSKYTEAASKLDQRFKWLPQKAGTLSSLISNPTVKWDLDRATKPIFESYGKDTAADAGGTCKNLLAGAQAVANIADKNLPRADSPKTAIGQYVGGTSTAEKLKAMGQ
jgi:hypothetical protein